MKKKELILLLALLALFVLSAFFDRDVMYSSSNNLFVETQDNNFDFIFNPNFGDDCTNIGGSCNSGGDCCSNNCEVWICEVGTVSSNGDCTHTEECAQPNNRDFKCCTTSTKPNSPYKCIEENYCVREADDSYRQTGLN